MTTITLQNLSLTYPGQDQPTLKALELVINSGRITALLGPSGCGKTTLLKLIAGLLDPTVGDILFNDKSILAIAPERRDTVLVYQNHLLFPYMDVGANVGFGLRMRGVSAGEIERLVSETLALVHLSGIERRRPADLSGGQQQRVALARALIVRPQVLLLDEPLSNLDSHLRLEMRDLIFELQRRTKVTCVFVTHDQEEAVVMADKVALLLDGRLHQYAQPHDFYERPASARVARFFGTQNLLPGTCAGNVFNCALGQLPQTKDCGSGSATLTIRPENIDLVPPGTDGAWDGTVVAAVYLGVGCRLQVQVTGRNGAPGTQLMVHTTAATYHRLVVGDPVGLYIYPERTWLVTE